MSIAVVFAARQQNGFSLCVELLEKGYTVYANDHSLWQNAEHEEKWLFIGRNANLHYLDGECEEIYQAIKDGETDQFLCFIPLIDYFDRDVSSVHKDLVKRIQFFSSSGERNFTFIFIQPSAITIKQSPFYNELESMKKNIQENHQVVEYFISDLDKNNNPFFYTSCTERIEVDSEQPRLIKEIINHLEENYSIGYFFEK